MEAQKIPDSQIAIKSFLNLLFKRLNQDQPEVATLRKKIDLELQSLHFACKSNSSIEISNCKKKIIGIFKHLLQWACVDDAQSMCFHFIKEVDRLIDQIQNGYQFVNISDSNIIDDEKKSCVSSPEDTFLFDESRKSLEIEKELFLVKTKIQTLRNMTSVYKKDTCLNQLNIFIKNDVSINDSIKSAVKLANDVSYVIDLMNQSLKNS